MKQTTRTVLVAAGTSLVVVALVVAALWWFLPARRPFVFGPGATERGSMMGSNGSFGSQFTDSQTVQFGRMGPGMMRDVHAMADVQNEYEYMSRMIPHHEEAIASAEMLRDQTDRREMRRFAERVIEVQSREVEQMLSWLAEWYSDRPVRAEYTPMMGDYADLAGNEIDVAFLRDMIPHHMAAVMMSQQLIVSDLSDHTELEELAASIRDSQMREIREMNAWLRDYTDS